VGALGNASERVGDRADRQGDDEASATGTTHKWSLSL
jgi:hypothetical protein